MTNLYDEKLLHRPHLIYKKCSEVGASGATAQAPCRCPKWELQDPSHVPCCVREVLRRRRSAVVGQPGDWGEI